MGMGKQCDTLYLAEWKKIILGTDRESVCVTQLTSSANSFDTYNTVSKPSEQLPINVTSAVWWLSLSEQRKKQPHRALSELVSVFLLSLSSSLLVSADLKDTMIIKKKKNPRLDQRAGTHSR